MRKKLCNEVEVALGRRLRTPKDFDFLREKIFQRVNILVSSTTLKRIWGYVDEPVEPRESTLTILSQFIGYKDWEDFERHGGNAGAVQSSIVLSRRLNVSESLTPGDSVLLTWQPESECLVEYLGNLEFCVKSSKNTRLTVGDRFQCGLIVDGEPLYIDNLRHENCPPTGYVCGKIAGVKFELPDYTKD